MIEESKVKPEGKISKGDIGKARGESIFSERHRVGPLVLEIKISKDSVDSTLHDETWQFISMCAREIASLEEEAVRRMLILRGWTPPEGEMGE